MKHSAIQWTDHTHNPWYGCRKVAPECDKCYIVRTPPLRRHGMRHGSERRRCSEATRRQPLAWDRAAAKAGRKDLVFCMSLGDWLDPEVPVEWLAELLGMIAATPNLIWQLLTKRPQMWRRRIAEALICNHKIGGPFDVLGGRQLSTLWLDEVQPPNVWIGVSAGADQRAALDIPARLHFLSCEPMLHPLDTEHAARFDWVIFGGESEPGGEPRSTDLRWIYKGIEFCRAHNIKPFVKQLGGRPTVWGERFIVSNAHGDNMEEWLPSLRVREIPDP
jgi:protein gp37